MQTNKFAYTSMCEKLKTLYDELQVIDAEIIASMCWMVFVEDGPTRETQAELAYALDVPMIYAAGGTPSGVKGHADGCLCWVDVPAVAASAGFRAIDAGGEWHVRTSLKT